MIGFVLAVYFVWFVLNEDTLPNSTDYKLGLILGSLVTFAAYVIGGDLGAFIGWCFVNFGGLK